MADSAYEVAATGIKAILDTEFSPEGFKAKHDCLHESLGTRRVEVGISPIRIAQLPNNASVEATFILIQFYGMWKKEVDPEMQVNPFKITGYAARLARALEVQQAQDPASNEVWFFTVIGTDFPRDPSGNKSRFEMTVRAVGDAPGLETRA